MNKGLQPITNYLFFYSVYPYTNTNTKSNAGVNLLRTLPWKTLQLVGGIHCRSPALLLRLPHCSGSAGVS